MHFKDVPQCFESFSHQCFTNMFKLRGVLGQLRLCIGQVVWLKLFDTNRLYHLITWLCKPVWQMFSHYRNRWVMRSTGQWWTSNPRGPSAVILFQAKEVQSTRRQWQAATLLGESCAGHLVGFGFFGCGVCWSQEGETLPILITKDVMQVGATARTQSYFVVNPKYLSSLFGIFQNTEQESISGHRWYLFR